MKRMTQKLKYAAAIPAVLAVNAYAEVPESVKQAIEAAKADGLEVGWVVVGVLAALFVIAIVRRVMR